MTLKEKLTRQPQMSEAFVLSAFLAFSGGLQDAYSYIVRDQVFANAQTGNIVLMSTQLLGGDLRGGVQYLFPLLAFSLGVYVTERVRRRFHGARRLHWRQGILAAEILLLLLVGVLPAAFNTPANCLISFCCAMQVQAFRTVGGHAYASTMCIGNLRSGVEALAVYRRTHGKKELESIRYYFGVILFFALGAGLGGNLSVRLGLRTIWLSSLLLLIAFLLMELDRER